MNVSIELEGPSSRTLTEIENHSENARQAVRQTFFYMGRHLKAKTSKNILDKSRKTGRIYIRRDKSGRRRRHQASAPGETHANRSGTLRKTIGTKIHSTDSLEIGYGVAKASLPPEHAEIEFGIGRVKKRPSLANTIDEEGREFETYFEKALEGLAG